MKSENRTKAAAYGSAVPYTYMHSKNSTNAKGYWMAERDINSPRSSASFYLVTLDTSDLSTPNSMLQKHMKEQEVVEVRLCS